MSADVELELYLDRLLYGTCFWRVVDGKKQRIAPVDVIVRADGTMVAPPPGPVCSQDCSATERELP